MSGADTEKPKSTGRGRRDIVVPMRLYKTITVFSTMIAAFSIVGGFFFLDAATLQVSIFRAILELFFASIGFPLSQDVLSGILATIGIIIIALGTGVFVLGTRFRTEGMGKSQEDSDEESTNG
ncbi:hypothetical protein HUB97_06205 [Halorubraceae archaeon YAN]|nr:hypothetical protein [Halorubraceae archaeon YAN]